MKRKQIGRTGVLLRHRDSAIVVVEKPSGLLTVRKPNDRGDNLVDLVRDFLAEPGEPRPHAWAAHRLDQNVSGLLVLARTEAARAALIEQFRAHTVERRYLALVQGRLHDEAGTFESYLREDPRTLRMYSDPDDEGQRAVTHWRVLERLKAATLIEVELETGQKNQIRVHFAEAGFPLFGERKYLDPGAKGASSVQGRSRIFLHAAVLGFVHPRTHKPMRFESKLPPELERALRKLSRA